MALPAKEPPAETGLVWQLPAVSDFLSGNLPPSEAALLAAEPGQPPSVLAADLAAVNLRSADHIAFGKLIFPRGALQPFFSLKCPQ